MTGRPKKHGDSYPTIHPLYNVWRNMNRRCSNPNTPQFKDWGGRGIAVCDEWKKDYTAFREWAFANGYSEDLTLDREDNDDSYTPDNCRWVKHKENCRNRRTKRVVIAFGEEKTLVEWSEDTRCKVKYYTLLKRLMKGWDTETAIQKVAA